MLLARALWHEGYDDHLAGHITVNQGDGTLLCNPWLLTWEEFEPEDVIRIDLDGNVVEGDWPAPLGIPLHLELHRARPGIGWRPAPPLPLGQRLVGMKRVPPLHDQSRCRRGRPAGARRRVRGRGQQRRSAREVRSSGWATPIRRSSPTTACS